MSRLKPTTKLDVIGDLDLNPEKVPGSFTESKLQNKLFVKPPNWDSFGDAIELLAIKNDREYKAMSKLQQESLQTTARQSAINRNRTHEIFQTQRILRQRFIEANGFFKDCDDKKKQANLKVIEEKQLHVDLKKQISKYKNDIDTLLEFREALLKTVADLEPYEKVIEEVVAHHDVWNSLKDCIDCSDALMMVQVEILETKKQKLQEIEAIRQKMVKKTNEAALTVLALNTKFTELEREYISAKSECMKWENILVNVKDSLLENSLTKVRMLDEIRIMYQKLCRRRGLGYLIKRQDIEQQMNFIRNEILVLGQVVRECHKTKF